MGKLILLSNFGDGYTELIQKACEKRNEVFSYIPSRTELGEVYYARVKKAYNKIGIKKFNYIDIDQKYKKEFDSIILKSDIVFLAGGDDPYIIKNLKKRNYDKIIRKLFSKGATIIGLCAGASILAQYTIVSDYNGIKFEDIHIIPWGIGISEYMYYSRFDDSCNLDSLKEFSLKYTKSILAASLNSAVIISSGKISIAGKVLLIEGDNVYEL